MVNTNMTHVFKHPKFYRIPRDKSDQVISKSSHDGESERAPGPGQSNKQQASHKLVTPRSDQKEATSLKQQAASKKPQAPSFSSNKQQAASPEQQASSLKPQAASSCTSFPS